MNKTMNTKVLRTPDEVAKRQGMWLTIVALVILYAVLFALDNFVKPNKFTLMLIPVLRKGAIYSLLCVSMNLLNGFTGLFSLGQAGFILIGAYAYSIFSIPAAAHASVYQYFDGGAIQFSIPEMLGNAIGVNAGSFFGAIICIIIAGLAAAVFAALIGLPVLRLKSDYLAIATLGFAEILRAFFQWKGLGVITNSSNLLRKYTAFSDMKLQIGSQVFKLSTTFPFLIAMISIIIIVLLINSSYGRAFKAIRDDEVAAEAMGINLAKHKMISFVVSSFFAGVSGATMAMVLSIAQANNYKVAMTYEILLMVVLGGIGSISGSVIGSLLFVATSEWWLRGLDSGKFLGIDAPGVFRNGFRLVVFSIGIPCAISGIVGNLLGSHFALKKGAKFIRPMMLVVLVLLLGKIVSDAVL